MYICIIFNTYWYEKNITPILVFFFCIQHLFMEKKIFGKYTFVIFLILIAYNFLNCYVLIFKSNQKVHSYTMNNNHDIYICRMYIAHHHHLRKTNRNHENKTFYSFSHAGTHYFLFCGKNKNFFFLENTRVLDVDRLSSQLLFQKRSFRPVLQWGRHKTTRSQNPQYNNYSI